MGKAIQWVIENEPVGSRFGRKDSEEWIFIGSKDGDLRLVLSPTDSQGAMTDLALQGFRSDQANL